MDAPCPGTPARPARKWPCHRWPGKDHVSPPTSGCEWSRAHGVYGDRGVGQLESQVFGEVDDGDLGGIVGGGVGSTHPRHVDDTASAAFEHHGIGAVATVEHYHQMDGNCPRPLRRIVVPHPAHGSDVARVVDQHVQGSKCSTVRRMALLTCEKSDTSAMIVMTSVPCRSETRRAVSSNSAAVRADSANRAPSAAKARAMARPTPLPLPVM